MTIYYGVVRSNVVELPDGVGLADGLMVEVHVLDPDVETSADVSAEEQFKQGLVAAGLLREIKRPEQQPLSGDRTPVTVEGIPLSELIVQERR